MKKEEEREERCRKKRKFKSSKGAHVLNLNFQERDISSWKFDLFIVLNPKEGKYE